MVWADTDMVGCGISDCSGHRLGSKYLICNYAPGLDLHKFLVSNNNIFIEATLDGME